VDELWRPGTGAGYRSDGAPGSRPEYGNDYYRGFLLDPDGNSAEAVHHLKQVIADADSKASFAGIFLVSRRLPHWLFWVMQAEGPSSKTTQSPVSRAVVPGATRRSLGNRHERWMSGSTHVGGRRLAEPFPRN
jgi:hypothetical protein